MKITIDYDRLITLGKLGSFPDPFGVILWVSRDRLDMRNTKTWQRLQASALCQTIQLN
tara:strand:+ start:364 stop:537 length:174 start_codon:yes stop_codon:yes gene_type:complete